VSIFTELRKSLRGDKRPHQAKPTSAKLSLHDLLWQRSLISSAEFIEANMPGAMLLRNKNEVRDYALGHIPKEGMLLEFGVYKGASINRFAAALKAKNDTRPIFGFDSFEGLSEEWSGHHRGAGGFSLDGKLPEVAENVRLVKGWIDETLPPFLDTNPRPIALLHIDTDTYSPAKTILSLCRDRLTPGSIVLFDEMFAYPGWANHEFKALNEIISPDRYAWRAVGGEAAMIEILRPI
jgi:hypothetical protein